MTAHPTNDSAASVEEIFAEFEPYKGKDYGSMTEYRITKFRLAEATARINQLLTERELYGRLHETIEAFQSGRISAAHYSSRHNELTEDLAALKDGGKHETTI